MGHPLLLMGRRRRRGRGKADDVLMVKDLNASIAAAHDVEFMVRKLVDFEVSSGIVHSALAHDLLHASQRGSSIAGAATLAQCSRRYCDPSHMSLLSSSVVMT
jgi:hypothetical protein